MADQTFVANIRRLVENRKSTRESVAHVYSLALKRYRAGAPQWREINRLIRTRWTRSGLSFIKRRAGQLSGQ